MDKVNEWVILIVVVAFWGLLAYFLITHGLAPFH